MKRLLVSFAALSLLACSGPASTGDQAKPTAIPITSKSPQAIDEFRKGRDLVENLRLSEAGQALDGALKLDPDFAQAHTYRGSAMSGPEGLKELERGVELSKSLPQPERLLTEAFLAAGRGESAKSAELWKQLTDAVPGDWRAWAGLGAQLYVSQKYSEAVAALKKATDLNPKAGPAYNMLGYAHLVQGEAGPAIDALKQYASVNPDEPNPQDSLGEALLAGGQFADAEAAFRKALALSPAFYVALEGVAYTKAYQSDWAAARDALKQALAAASRPSDRFEVQSLDAALTFAEGKTAVGLEQLTVLEKSPDASPIDAGFVPASRAMALVDASRHKEAQAEIARALQTADGGALPPGAARALRRTALSVRAASEGLSGNAAAVEATVAALQKDAATRPDDAPLQSSIHFGQGMLAVARKDAKTAMGHFALCTNQDEYCHWEAFMAARKAGDRAGADAARARLTKLYVRTPGWLVARSALNRMTPKPTR